LEVKIEKKKENTLINLMSGLTIFEIKSFRKIFSWFLSIDVLSGEEL